MSKTSIVIRCYNEEQHIGRLLSGIFEQTVKDVEVILVDSGSTDATLSIASRYPVTIAFIAPEEFSFGRSLNLGCARATGEFIVIASAHIYPLYKDWLEKLLEPFRIPEVVLVYGKQRGNENTKYSEHQIYKKWFPDVSTNLQKHPFCNNANAAIRRSIWEHMPYNDELTGLEDLDWAKRVTELGKKIAYSIEAEIVHVHNETPLTIYNRYKREAMAFKRIYPHERFHIWDFFKLFAANVIIDYYHSCRDRMLFKNIAGIPMYRLMQFWGTYRGYAKHGFISQQLRNHFYYPNGLSIKPVDRNIEKERLIDYEHH
jgi:glycosyltransferase involved in cell wall biosynthesis